MRRHVLLVVLLLPGVALADDPLADVPDVRVVVPAVQHLELEGTELHGQRMVPGATLLGERPRAVFHPQVRIRRTFDDHVARSVDDVR